MLVRCFEELNFGNLIVTGLSLVMLGGAVAISVVLNNFWFIGVGFVLWLGLILAWSYLVSVAGQVYRCALFLYASQGTVPDQYTQEHMDGAWKFKKS